jgi:hypothetical protein
MRQAPVASPSPTPPLPGLSAAHVVLYACVLFPVMWLWRVDGCVAVRGCARARLGCCGVSLALHTGHHPPPFLPHFVVRATLLPPPSLLNMAEAVHVPYCRSVPSIPPSAPSPLWGPWSPM